MSRLKKFTQSLLSGYFTIAANTIYTFISIPLALHYLSTSEYGLWGLTVDIAGYIALVDAGMSGSVSRMLIDHKDHPSNGAYGSIIKTGALVGIVQGLIILALGIGLAFSMSALLRVPPELRHDFTWLMVGQTAALAFSFMTRIFMQILVAHQRYDVSNYAQGVVFLLSIAAMWAGFAMGFGVLSFLAVQILSALVLTFVNFAATVRLRLLPPAGHRGHVTGQRFNELFKYGGALFIFTMGMQFLNASQTILLTRFMGLAAAGVWTAATRVFKLIAQLIWRSQEFTGPPLAEMLVRGEITRMRDRLRDMTFVTTNFALFGALVLTVCNNTFVELWTHGRISWNPLNDLLLGLWLVVTTAMRAHVYLSGATKRFEFLSSVCFAEGFVFIILNLMLKNVDGITRMLFLSVLCTACFTLSYNLQRTRRFFSLTVAQIAAWHQSTWQVAWRLAFIGFGLWMLTKGWQPIPRLAANAMISAIAGSLAVLRYGFGRSLQNDIAEKLPPVLRRILLSVRAS